MAEKDVKGFSIRCLVMALGVTLVGISIAMAKESGMGTSPISCIPAVMVELTRRAGIPLTMGMLTFGINFVFLIGEIVLLKGRFPWAQLLQLTILFITSAVIDLSTPFIAAAVAAVPLGHVLCLLLSLPIMALGVYTTVRANVLMLPAEAIVFVFSRVFDKPFHKCKLVSDIALALGGVVISLVFLGGLYGVREGTIINACTVGMLVRMWEKVLAPIMRHMPSTDYNPIPPVIKDYE